MQDCQQYRIRLLQHFVVPEAYYAVTSRLNKYCSFKVIILLISMLAAVHFNDQLLARGTEIHQIRSYGMLTAKMDIF